MKYKIIDEKHSIYNAYRIKALKDFADVKAGDLGGFIESQDNLSQNGNCWVYDDAIVHKNAIIYDNASIYDNAIVSNNAKVYGNASIFHNVQVSNNAKICDNVRVYDTVKVYGNAKIFSDIKLFGDITITENAIFLKGLDKLIIYEKGYVCIDDFCGTLKGFKNKLSDDYGRLDDYLPTHIQQYLKFIEMLQSYK